MGIAELAARLLVDPEKDGQGPPMGERDVRSQLYGRAVPGNNVLSASTRGRNGRPRDRGWGTASEAAEQPSELDRSLDGSRAQA